MYSSTIVWQVSRANDEEKEEPLYVIVSWKSREEFPTGRTANIVRKKQRGKETVSKCRIILFNCIMTTPNDPSQIQNTWPTKRGTRRNEPNKCKKRKGISINEQTTWRKQPS